MSNGRGHANGKSADLPRRRDVDPALQRAWDGYARCRDAEARNRLVEAYQDLAHEIVRRFAKRLPPSIDRGDLHTAASVGLMAAIEGYDPQRGVPFEVYCELRVKGALLDELRTQDWLPRPWRHRLEQQKRVLERLRGDLEREPDDQEVAAALEMPLAEYEQVFGTGMPCAPAGSSRVFSDDELLPNLDVVADTTSDAPGEKLSREELLRFVADRLSEQEYRIVYLKYWEGLPMREIGEMTGLSESRVCKVHARLIERLKDRFRVAMDD